MAMLVITRGCWDGLLPVWCLPQPMWWLFVFFVSQERLSINAPAKGKKIPGGSSVGYIPNYFCGASRVNPLINKGYNLLTIRGMIHQVTLFRRNVLPFKDSGGRGRKGEDKAVEQRVQSGAGSMFWGHMQNRATVGEEFGMWRAEKG